MNKAERDVRRRSSENIPPSGARNPSALDTMSTFERGATVVS